MARPKKPKREPLTNIEARQACVRDGFAARFALEQQIAGLEAEHIKSLKDQQKKAWKNVSANTGFAVTDLNDQYRLYKRQEQAKDFDEESDRDTVLDAQREIFESLQAGETLDFMAVLAKAPQKRGRKPNAPDGAVADGAAGGADPQHDTEPDTDRDPVNHIDFLSQRGAGINAFNVGDDVDANPHAAGTPEYEAFNAGYYRAEGVNARDSGEAVSACRYPVGYEAWKRWGEGWNSAAAKDGEDAATVGAKAAEKLVAAGESAETDPTDIPAFLDRRQAAGSA